MPQYLNNTGDHFLVGVNTLLADGSFGPYGIDLADTAAGDLSISFKINVAGSFPSPAFYFSDDDREYRIYRLDNPALSVTWRAAGSSNSFQDWKDTTETGTPYTNDTLITVNRTGGVWSIQLGANTFPYPNWAASTGEVTARFEILQVNDTPEVTEGFTDIDLTGFLPPPSVEIDGEEAYTVGDTLQLIAQADGGGRGLPSSYLWTQLNGPSVTESGGTSQTLTLTDHVAGAFEYKVLVTWSDGKTAEAAHSFDIVGAPVAKITDLEGNAVATYEGYEFQPILYFGHTSENAARWEWDFDESDGYKQFDLLRCSHMWRAPGTYTLTLKVWNAAGALSTDTATVTVNEILNRAPEYVTTIAEINSILNTYAAAPVGLPPHIKIAAGSEILTNGVNIYPPVCTWDGFAIIETDSPLPSVDERIFPGDERLAKLTTNNATTPVVDGRQRATGGLWFRGIEFATTIDFQSVLVDLHMGELVYKAHLAASNVGSNFIFTHCAADTRQPKGDPGTARTIYGDAEFMTFAGCTFLGNTNPGQDTQAFLCASGRGRHSFYNCGFEATGENIMYGGGYSGQRLRTPIDRTSTTTELKVDSVEFAELHQPLSVEAYDTVTYPRGMVWSYIRGIDTVNKILTVDALPFAPAIGTKVNFGWTPSDIEFRYCLFEKPNFWRDEDYGDVKNSFEIKHANRVIVADSVVRRMWRAAQWAAVNLKSAPQGGVSEEVSYVRGEDIHFRNVRVDTVLTDRVASLPPAPDNGDQIGPAQCFNIVDDGPHNATYDGSNNPTGTQYVSAPPRRIGLHNVLLDTGDQSLILNHANEITIENVTANSASRGIFVEGYANDVTIKNSLIRWGMTYQNDAGGQAGFDLAGTGWSAEGFAFNKGAFPAVHTTPPGGIVLTDFDEHVRDARRGDLRLAISSGLNTAGTGGGPIGADLSLIPGQDVVDGLIGVAPTLETPGVPTGGSWDGDLFKFTPAAGYRSIEHEWTPDGGATWITVTPASWREFPLNDQAPFGLDTSGETVTDFDIRVKAYYSRHDAGAMMFGDPPITDGLQLYMSLNGAAYEPVTALTPARYYNSSNLTDGDPTTNRLSTADFVAGEVTEDGTVIGLTIPAGDATELLAALELDSASLSDGDEIDFRWYKDGSPLDSYTVTPRVTIQKAGAFSIAANTGNFTYSGGAAGLYFNRRLEALGGSFAYSGANANLLRGLLLAAQAGVFSYAGGDAALSRAISIAANTGVFSYAGSDAGLARAIAIAANTGVFSYAGANVNLLIGRILAAATGVFSYAGGDASLFKTSPGAHTIAADTGAFSYSGGAANLLFNRKLEAGTGSFAYSGGDAILALGRILIAAPGVFSYAGNAASFLLGRVLSAETGNFAYSGADAQLLTARILAAATGVFVYAGGDAELLKTTASHYVLTAAGGVFSYQGANASFAVIAPYLRPSPPLALEISTGESFLELSSGEAFLDLAAGKTFLEIS